MSNSDKERQEKLDAITFMQKYRGLDFLELLKEVEAEGTISSEESESIKAITDIVDQFDALEALLSKRDVQSTPYSVKE